MPRDPPGELAQGVHPVLQAHQVAPSHGQSHSQPVPAACNPSAAREAQTRAVAASKLSNAMLLEDDAGKYAGEEVC